MRLFVNFLAGLIFGAGLLISGMADPAKVLNFLDLAGAWDPSLAFVMAGAIAVAAPGFALVRLLASPLLEDHFQLPPTQPIDRQLIAGAAIFGLGWGLSGFCPGPALTSIAKAAPGTVAFVVAMLAGIALATLARPRGQTLADD